MVKRLDEIVLLRPIAILLVVFYHSFAIYDGKWSLPNGVDPSITYDWIADFAYSFMLPLFVLISGYLFSYQLFERNKVTSFKGLVISKFRRLLVPCYVFGILYLVIIDHPEIYDIKSFALCVIDLLSGAGHLWFLPMLFWCFVAVYIMNCIGLNTKYMLLVSMIIYFIGPKTIPLGLGYTCWYLVYFVLGVLFRKRNECLSNVSRTGMMLTIVSYLISFVSINLLLNNYYLLFGDIPYTKIIHYLLFKTGTLMYGTLGCLMAYLIAINVVNKLTKIPSVVVWLDSISFGIYIYHQFILKFIYYNTGIPHINTPLLPWVAFVSAILVSCFFSVLTRSCRLGRSLIG